MFMHSEKDGNLTVGGIPAVDLVKEYGSPLYVYDGDCIRDAYKRLDSAIPYKNKRIYYAAKANTNPYIMNLLYNEGAYIDAVSVGEIVIALSAGFPSDRILFTATNIGEGEMAFAIQNKVIVNIGSLYSLRRYGELYPGTDICIRVNPAMGAGHHDHVITGGEKAKFGIYATYIKEAQSIIKEFDLKLIGVHAHIGSGILEENKFMEVMNIILPIAKEFEHIQFVDFGGGIGVPYRADQKEFDLKLFGEEASRLMQDFSKAYGTDITLAVEPGRFLVADSGVLLTTVTDIKTTPKYAFAGVDSGFNHLIRPMAYGSYHTIVNASNLHGPKKSVIVAGYLCESGDVFTRTEEGSEPREMAEPKPGDVLAILTAGAYGFAMSSQYNSRLRPAEVMALSGVATLIRRRETFDDLLSTMV